jgi:hypothetical protein
MRLRTRWVVDRYVGVALRRRERGGVFLERGVPAFWASNRRTFPG